MTGDRHDELAAIFLIIPVLFCFVFEPKTKIFIIRVFVVCELYYFTYCNDNLLERKKSSKLGQSISIRFLYDNIRLCSIISSVTLLGLFTSQEVFSCSNISLLINKKG